jgi:hypothetical protein
MPAVTSFSLIIVQIPEPVLLGTFYEDDILSFYFKLLIFLGLIPGLLEQCGVWTLNPIIRAAGGRAAGCIAPPGAGTEMRGRAPNQTKPPHVPILLIATAPPCWIPRPKFIAQNSGRLEQDKFSLFFTRNFLRNFSYNSRRILGPLLKLGIRRTRQNHFRVPLKDNSLRRCYLE